MNVRSKHITALPRPPALIQRALLTVAVTWDWRAMDTSVQVGKQSFF